LRQAPVATVVGALLAFSVAPAHADTNSTPPGAPCLKNNGNPCNGNNGNLGQQGNALPPDGFGDFLVSLRRRGFTPQEVDRMAKQNPARLLGLP